MERQTAEYNLTNAVTSKTIWGHVEYRRGNQRRASKKVPRRDFGTALGRALGRACRSDLRRVPWGAVRKAFLKDLRKAVGSASGSAFGKAFGNGAWEGFEEGPREGHRKHVREGPG